jgi:hypothetical protein
LLTLQYLLVIHRKAWLWNNTENMGAGNPYSFSPIGGILHLFPSHPAAPQ